VTATNIVTGITTTNVIEAGRVFLLAHRQEESKDKRCKMKPAMLLGIVLIVLGVAGLAFQGISYTTREKVVDIGDLAVTATTRKTIPIPLVVGGLALAGGIAVVVVTTKKP